MSSSKGWYIDVKYKNYDTVPGANNFNARTESELEEIVGKELATKIISDNIEPMQKKEYTGLDLQVGGEGMEVFYDSIIPKAAKKLGKPFGANVEVINIDKTRRTVIYSCYRQNERVCIRRSSIV